MTPRRPTKAHVEAPSVAALRARAIYVEDDAEEEAVN